MIKRHFSKLATIVLVVLMSSNVSAKESQNNFFVDLLVLQEGKTEADAKRYFDSVVPIVARHGLVRINGYSISAVYAGDERPKLVNLWAMAHDQVFSAISEDPEYKKMVPTRNKLFDMKKSHMYVLDQI